MGQQPKKMGHFTDLGFWPNQPNPDESGYTLALMRAQIAEAKLRWPGLEAALPSVADDLWKHGSLIVGYSEYSVAWWKAEWSCGGKLLIEMNLYYGYQYENDGDDSIVISLKGLPDGKSLWGTADFKGNVIFEWSK